MAARKSAIRSQRPRAFANLLAVSGHLLCIFVLDSLNFKKPVTFGDPMEISVGVSRIGNRSVEFRYEVRHRETGEVHAVADITTAVVDMRTFTPMSPPAHILQALESIRTGR